MKLPVSEQLFEEAQRLIPGGVNSPVRAFGQVGGTPPFIRSGQGARVRDEDGSEYLDYVGSWGPLILGHAHPAVVRAACEACERGSSFGAPTRSEVDLARAIVEAVPSVEMVRLVSSGTEAVMSVLRLARAYTGRDLIVKFEGCYHGHSDGLLARAGSGLATLGIPDVPGVPASFATQTLILPYNDLAAAAAAFEGRGSAIAAVIVEPIAGNMGVVPPAAGFLEGLREITASHGALLILDEVITGFRVGRGGAQELFGIRPDLTTLGKIIGGGFPLAAYGGRRDIMAMVSPSGPVYQAGTLSGNPVATAAGLATLEQLTPEAYAGLEATAERLASGLKQACAGQRVPASLSRVGSMMTLFFNPNAPTNFATVTASDSGLYGAVHRGLLERGIYFPPSAFEAFFVSTAHTPDVIDTTITAFDQALAEALRTRK